VDAVYLSVVVESGPDDGACGGVHPGAVAARTEDRKRGFFVAHAVFLLYTWQ
jgi:hypothetical protein